MVISQISFSQTNLRSETIPVSGNCEMCKKRIETAAKKAGAVSADWNVDTKILAVTFRNSSGAAKIQQSIAGAGYDTRDIKADDKAYNKLPGCCKYARADHNVNVSCCDQEKCTNTGNCCSGMDCCKDGKCSTTKMDPNTLGNHDQGRPKAAGHPLTCCENGICKMES